MFDFVRSHTRLFQGLLVLLIFPSFVFFGVQGYSRFTDGTAAQVAEVDGRGITQMEWDAAHQRNVERLRQQMPNVDVKLLDTPAMRLQTLDGMVRERVLLAAADHLHLSVSDEQLQRVFATDPQFAPLRNPDGSINRDLLVAQGMSSEMFAQSLRQDLAVRQVLQGIGATVVAPKAVVDPSLDALLQRRQVQMQRFDTQAYRAKVKPSDAEIEAFYKAHEASFRAPEQARIAEDAGVAALAMHGRTRVDLYNGEAEYDTITAVKAAVKIPVLANGDIRTPEQAKFVLEKTGADAVMIGRGAQGRPWIFREISHYLATGKHLPEPGAKEVRDILMGHLEHLHAFYGEVMGVRIARKHLGWYAKDRPENADFRQIVNRAETAASQLELTRDYFNRLQDLMPGSPARLT